ncbi:hypothetical protein [Hymenobacter amundsenii]|uniref:hypothetical protein n=1 Tax=Hymenobacter amundsenii TaxID=2006685 RepID=UPI000F84A4D6|nr:hypothetical protein [Hymenobacter amundsenii]
MVRFLKHLIMERPSYILILLITTFTLTLVLFSNFNPKNIWDKMGKPSSKAVVGCTPDYKNLSSPDQRALDQKMKTCGCPTKVYQIKEYAAFAPEKAQRVLGVKVGASTKAVIAVRSGWAYDFSDCKRGRYWSDTGANGELLRESNESVNSLVGSSIGGNTVADNFGVEF